MRSSPTSPASPAEGRSLILVRLATATLALSLAALPACAHSRRGAPMPSDTTAQAPPAAPARVDLLRQLAETWRFRLGQPASPVIAGRRVLFLRSGPRSFTRALWELNLDTGVERVALTAAALLGGEEGELSPEEKARRERMRQAERGIATFAASEDGSRLLVPLAGRVFVIDTATWVTREVTGAAGGLAPRLSPAGDAVAFSRGGNLWVAPLDASGGGGARRLTTDGGGEISNGLAEFIAQEEMGRMDGLWWSPDGGRIIVQRTDTTPVERIYIADPAHPERAPDAWPYPRAGRANADVRLAVVAATGGDPVWLAWDHARYPYLASVRWDEGAPPLLVVMTREQQELAVLTADPATGATRPLVVETDGAWLNLDPSVPRWLPGGELLWSSERSGQWQLEVRAGDGTLLRGLTAPEHGYRHVAAVLDDAALVVGGPEPTETHVYTVPLDGGPPTLLTAEPGEHQALGGDGGGGLWVDATEGPDSPPTFVVRDAAGVEVGRLRSEAEEPLVPPRVERVTVGERELRAAVVRPSDFDPDSRYPVLVSVYGGPHARVVSAARNRYATAQWIAEQGFVVVYVDGRGTPDRGRAWERAIRGDLTGPALTDQVAGLRALGERFPELDLSRVGIFGWSFGGTMAAMAVLREPDVFHAAVAGAPVTEWRHYDTCYTERYLGLPDADPGAYDRSSPLSVAASLRRPLLLIHGTADDNVLLLHSMLLSRALFDAGLPHGFLPLAGETHMVSDPDATVRLYTRVIDAIREGTAGRPSI